MRNETSCCRTHHPDPERFFHHDRVFLNNPVVMQGMGLAPLVVLATSGQNALMLAVAVALLLTPSRMLACLLSRLFPPAGGASGQRRAGKEAAAPQHPLFGQRGGGLSGGVPHPEPAVRREPAGAGHLSAHAGGGAAADLPLRPRAGDDEKGRLQGHPHHHRLRPAAAFAGLCARVAERRYGVRPCAEPSRPAHGQYAGRRLHRAGRAVCRLAHAGQEVQKLSDIGGPRPHGGLPPERGGA